MHLRRLACTGLQAFLVSLLRLYFEHFCFWGGVKKNPTSHYFSSQLLNLHRCCCFFFLGWLYGVGQTAKSYIWWRFLWAKETITHSGCWAAYVLWGVILDTLSILKRCLICLFFSFWHTACFVSAVKHIFVIAWKKQNKRRFGFTLPFQPAACVPCPLHDFIFLHVMGVKSNRPSVVQRNSDREKMLS